MKMMKTVYGLCTHSLPRRTPHFLLVLFSVFLVVFSSVPSLNAYTYFPDEQCVPCNKRCRDGGWGKVGATILGMAAGAAVAIAANNRKGDTGSQGPQGVPGPLPFEEDVGESITFDFELTLALGLYNSGIVPFVERPDGVVVTASAFDPLIAVLQTRQIVIEDPIFGTYHFGVETPTALLLVSTNLDTTITTSRGPTTTEIIIPISQAAAAPPSQFTEDFTYGEPGTVP